MKKKLLLVLALATAATMLLSVDMAANVMANIKKTGKKALPIFFVKKGELAPVVRLVRDGRTFCSGVVVSDDTIITASHCVVEVSLFGAVVDQSEIEIRASDNNPIGVTARVKQGSISGQLDRAILKGDFRQFTPAPYLSDVETIVKAVRVPGTKLVSCGYPMGGRLYCSYGSYTNGIGFMFELNNVLIPGMSGGPTMLLDGTVVAINVAVEGESAVVGPLYNVDAVK